MNLSTKRFIIFLWEILHTNCILRFHNRTFFLSSSSSLSLSLKSFHCYVRVFQGPVGDEERLLQWLLGVDAPVTLQYSYRCRKSILRSSVNLLDAFPKNVPVLRLSVTRIHVFLSERSKLFKIIAEYTWFYSIRENTSRLLLEITLNSKLRREVLFPPNLWKLESNLKIQIDSTLFCFQDNICVLKRTSLYLCTW